MPQAFPGILGESLTGRALKDGLWQLRTIDLRDFGEGRHRAVDDTPAGGGAGMVLRADVMARAIAEAQAALPRPVPLLYLSPRGVPFDQPTARRLAAGDGATLICGRFEGLDQRVIDEFGITELSLGDFVLTGGEIAAQAVIDAAVQIHGGDGVRKGHVVESLYREIRALRIYEGASDVQKVIIARQILAAQGETG
jgi:tRNA (guanine37-N1)-methyltransferase